MANYDLGLATKAIETLDNFPVVLLDIDNNIGQVHLGPWKIHCEYHYDMALFKGRINAFDATIDFTESRTQIQKAIDDGYGFSRRLLVDSKAEMARMLSRITDIRSLLDQALAATPDTILPLLQQIDTNLSTYISDLTGEEVALRAYSTQVATLDDTVSQLDLEFVGQDIQKTLENLKQQLAAQPGDPSNALGQFEVFQNIITQSAHQLHKTMDNLKLQTNTTLQALHILCASMNNFEIQWKSSLQAFNGVLPGSDAHTAAITNIDVPSAQKAWLELEKDFTQILNDSQNPFKLI